MKKLNRKTGLGILLSVLCLAAAVLTCLLILDSCFGGREEVFADCNRDGKVNAIDSNLLCRYVGGARINISPTGSDINVDGLLNEADRSLLREYIAEAYLPGVRFDAICLNGVDISSYVIVLPKNSSDFESWTANIFSDTVESLSGKGLEIVTDEAEEKPYEILIGETSRAESAGIVATDGQYMVFSSGTKIVMKGNDYFVGGGAGYIISSLENSDAPWNGQVNVDISSETVSRMVEWEVPENVFYIIGDGMGLNHTLMTTDPDPLLEYANSTVSPPDESGCSVFWPATFDHVGDAVTLNIQQSTTDSAASATALSTGYKTLNGALGMIPADLDGDGVEDEFRSVQNVRELATLRGKATAVLSTDKITGATPNAFLIHHYTRKDRNIITEQQKALASSRLACNYLWCSYDSDDALDKFIDSVDTCDDNPGGFFIMFEEGMIDKYAEKMDYDNAIRTVKRLNKVAAYAATYAMCHRDTVIVITADHETGGLTYGEDGVWRWTSDGEHTARNVPVFAMGYGTEYFHMTTRDNTEISKFVSEAVKYK